MTIHSKKRILSKSNGYLNLIAKIKYIINLPICTLLQPRNDKFWNSSKFTRKWWFQHKWQRGILRPFSIYYYRHLVYFAKFWIGRHNAELWTYFLSRLTSILLDDDMLRIKKKFGLAFSLLVQSSSSHPPIGAVLVTNQFVRKKSFFFSNFCSTLEFSSISAADRIQTYKEHMYIFKNYHLHK